MRILILATIGLSLAGCTRLRDEDIQREIASMERVATGQVDLVDVVILDGWSDGADAKIRYRVCRDRKRTSCAEKQLSASFALRESGRWEMFSYRG